MRKKSAQFLTMLILMMGGVCFSGCDKDNEEDPLGASRPNYNMLSDLSKGDIGLYLTEWEWANTFGITMKLSFDRQECTYTYTDTGKCGRKRDNRNNCERKNHSSGRSHFCECTERNGLEETDPKKITCTYCHMQNAA